MSLVLAIQILPLAQIGYALSSNQWTEELPHGAMEKSEKTDGQDICKTFLGVEQYKLTTTIFNAKVLAFIHTSDITPHNFSNDVVSPPPDVILFS